MRIAFVGKGGAGKSVIAGTAARLLARSGQPVLGVDSDPMPGLAWSIGVEASDAGIPDDAVVDGPEGGPRFTLHPDLSPLEAVERYAATGPDGVRFLQFGKLRGAAWELARSQFAFRQIVSGLPDEPWHIVGDLPGGTRQPFFGWAGYARVLLVVVEPTAKGLLSARRLARLGNGEGAPTVVAVANKITDPRDAELVAERTGLQVVAAVPHDDALAEAERRGRPAVDHDPDSAAVRAVASLLRRLRQEVDR